MQTRILRYKQLVRQMLDLIRNTDRWIYTNSYSNNKITRYIERKIHRQIDIDRQKDSLTDIWLDGMIQQ